MHFSLSSWKCLLLLLEAVRLLWAFCRWGRGFWEGTNEGWEPPRHTHTHTQGRSFSSCLGINVIDQMSMLELEGNLEFVPSFSRWWHCHVWLLPLAFLSQQEEPGRWDFTIAGGWAGLSSGLWEKGFVNPMLLSSSYFVWQMHSMPESQLQVKVQALCILTNTNHQPTGPSGTLIWTIPSVNIRLSQKKGWGPTGLRDFSLAAKTCRKSRYREAKSERKGKLRSQS